MGTGGRIPPNTVIEDDATGSVETSGVFDPDHRRSSTSTRASRACACSSTTPLRSGPTETDFGETPVIGDDGANAVRPHRAAAGSCCAPNDGNPERVTLDDVSALRSRM